MTKTDADSPRSSEWAGSSIGRYWSFVRDGRWHLVDVIDGTPLGILVLPEPFADW